MYEDGTLLSLVRLTSDEHCALALFFQSAKTAQQSGLSRTVLADYPRDAAGSEHDASALQDGRASLVSRNQFSRVKSSIILRERPRAYHILI